MSTVEKIARFNNWICKNILMFPKSILQNDRCSYHNTNVPQSTWELTCTGLIHFSATFFCVTVVDFAIVRPFTRFIQKTFKPWYTEVKRVQLSTTTTSTGAVIDDENDIPAPTTIQKFQQQGSSNESTCEAVISSPKTAAKSTDPRKVSWFLLHALFNGVIAATCNSESLEVLSNPVHGVFPKAPDGKGWVGASPGGLMGAIMIAGFHFQHTIFYRDLLTTEDMIHHFVNATAVVVVGMYCPWGNLTSLSNSVMCAYPGGIIYLALYLQKLGFMTRFGYKKVGRAFNMLMRFPVQALVFYIGMMHILKDHGVRPDASLLTTFFMLLGGSAHTINAAYYCDQVVGSYYLEEADIQRRKKLEKAQ